MNPAQFSQGEIGHAYTTPSVVQGKRYLHFCDTDGKYKVEVFGTEAEKDKILADLYARMLTKANASPASKAPMSREEYQEFLEATLNRLKEVMRQKNADYTGGDNSPFANFKVSEHLGLADAKTGLLIRMVDKIQRLKTFIAKGELQVEGEGAEDAALDIVGYGLLLLGMLEDGKRTNSNK